MGKRILIVISLMIMAGAVLAIVPGMGTSVKAYDQYSTNQADNCAACHGDFRAAPYTSLVDGSLWGVTTDLHDGHRTTMLSGDCNVCHFPARFPVFMNRSTGGTGFSAISCVGCHGRLENGPGGPGIVRGTGLRQHHTRAGELDCIGCHTDANLQGPGTFTPVAENVPPPYYFTPDAAHPNKPTDPCNTGGNTESKVASALGLDNDGNGLFDLNDPACSPDAEPPVVQSFVVPVTSNSLTVPITEFIATDNIGVTGFLITESPNTPAATGPPWTPAVPINFVFATEGQKTLFAWAKDAVGNVSNSRQQSVTITDITPPTVTSFVIPANHNTLAVPIIAFTATDDFGVTGYMITESNVAPLNTDPNWLAAAPTSFSFATPGAKTLFAWVKDGPAGAGNVSSLIPASQASVTITLTTFADVPQGHVAFNHVEAIVAAGITLGCQADNPGTPENEANFCPDLVVDRGQMASFIVRAVDGGNATTCSGAVFTDVTAVNPHCANIERLSTLGITAGCGPNTYCPGNSVPREQMAAFLIRAVLPGNPPGVCAAPPFPDIPVTNPFCRHIEELVARTITLGCIGDDPLTPANEARFCPANSVTRAQMAIFLGRAFLNIP